LGSNRGRRTGAARAVTARCEPLVEARARAQPAVEHQGVQQPQPPLAAEPLAPRLAALAALATAAAAALAALAARLVLAVVELQLRLS